MNDIIIKRIKEEINNTIKILFQNFYYIVDKYKNILEQILRKKPTKPLPLDMINLNETVFDYSNSVKNQKK